MRYEKSHILQNLVFQLTLAALVLGALIFIDHEKPELAGIMHDQQAVASIVSK
jgi:hypothetical protein